MKNVFALGLICLSVSFAVSCGSSKKSTVSPAVQSERSQSVSLEGDRVTVENVKLQGIEMAESLNDDGTAMIQRPYKWFAGLGQADNKQMAIELAQREAYATISRVLSNAVLDEAERGNVANNGRVQQALTSHWSQVSTTLQKACEPFGSTTVEYNPSTGMYSVTAKVAIRGDRFNRLLKTAGEFKPSELSGLELEQFIQTNKAIMEAARGN